MALLYDVNFLSASQLLMLGWGASGERAGQQRLKRPARQRLLGSLSPGPRSGTCRVELPPQLSRLVGADRATLGTSRPRLHARRDHEHQLRRTRPPARRARPSHCPAGCARSSAGGLIDRMPFTWKGPRSGRIDTDTTEDFERSAAAKLAPGTRLHAEKQPPRLSGARRHADRRIRRGALGGADRVRPDRTPAQADRPPAPLRLVAARRLARRVTSRRTRSPRRWSSSPHA